MNKKMETWVMLSLLAAASFAAAGLAAKVALNKDYMGLEVPQGAILTMTGVVLGFLAFLAVTHPPDLLKIKPQAAAAGLAVGLFWALGQILVYYALMGGADASRIAPIYNMNTLLVVAGGIVLLNELPDKTQAIRVIAGALLITAGGLLVSI